MKGLKAILIRLRDDGKSTLGVLTVYYDNQELYQCYTVEPSWFHNLPNVSCIPTGVYSLERTDSPHFGVCLAINGVIDRTHILIHGGNYYYDTKGCILPGSSLSDLNKDGFFDVTNSRRVLNELMDSLNLDEEIEFVVANHDTEFQSVFK